METLDLDNNAFTGPLPASWGSLKALASLNLNGNQLTGGIPPSWGALGRTLSESHGLYLSDNPGLVGCLPRGLEKFQGKLVVCEGTGLKCSVC
jgi:hypothetical protein